MVEATKLISRVKGSQQIIYQVHKLRSKHLRDTQVTTKKIAQQKWVKMNIIHKAELGVGWGTTDRVAS